MYNLRGHQLVYQNDGGLEKANCGIETETEVEAILQALRAVNIEESQRTAIFSLLVFETWPAARLRYIASRTAMDNRIRVHKRGDDSI
jgi:hypothetical protein